MDSVLAQLTDGQSLLQVVLEGTLIGQLVLVSLLLLSSLSWAVIILKGLQFYRFQKDDQNFLLLFRESSLDQTYKHCLLYTSPSPRDVEESRMPSSA